MALIVVTTSFSAGPCPTNFFQRLAAMRKNTMKPIADKVECNATFCCQAQVNHYGCNGNGEDNFAYDASVTGKAEPAGNVWVKSEVDADTSDDNADSGYDPAQSTVKVAVLIGVAL